MSKLKDGIAAFSKGVMKADAVTAAHANWKAGKAPVGPNETFAFKHFDNHPDVFGQKIA